LAEVHDRDAGFGFGFDGEGVGAWFQINCAEVAFYEFLEAACVLDGHFEDLGVVGFVFGGEDEFNFCAAAAFTAALEGEEVEGGGVFYFQVPGDVVVFVGPVADGVFFGFGFVADGFAVDGGVAGVEEDGAVGGRGDGLSGWARGGLGGLKKGGDEEKGGEEGAGDHKGIVSRDGGEAKEGLSRLRPAGEGCPSPPDPLP
jgi:hypothetical protein